MKFYKEADGDWIINGEIIPAGTCRQKTESATGRITIKLIGAPLLESTLALKMLPTDFQDANGNYYADLAAYELATSDFFVDAALAAAEQLEVDLGVEVQNRTSEDDNLQNQINAVASGYLGAIAYNAAAPTPGKSGYYEFLTAGICAWITGTPTVKVGDRVAVKYTEPGTYTYTHINVMFGIEQLLGSSTTSVVSQAGISNQIFQLFDPKSFSNYGGSNNWIGATGNTVSVSPTAICRKMKVVPGAKYLVNIIDAGNGATIRHGYAFYSSYDTVNSTTFLSGSGAVSGAISIFEEITIPAGCYCFAVSDRTTYEVKIAKKTSSIPDISKGVTAYESLNSKEVINTQLSSFGVLGNSQGITETSAKGAFAGFWMNYNGNVRTHYINWHPDLSIQDTITFRNMTDNTVIGVLKCDFSQNKFTIHAIYSNSGSITNTKILGYCLLNPSKIITNAYGTYYVTFNNSINSYEQFIAGKEFKPSIISLYGDSLTALGSGYANYFNNPPGMTVNAHGTGGENTKQISGRLGTIPFLIRTDFTIPSDTSTVTILLKSSWDGSDIVPYSAYGMNNCFIRGVEGTIASINNTTVTFTRITAGTSVNVKAGEKVITYSSANLYNQILILFMGQNGGWTGADELVSQFEANANKMYNAKYIFITPHLNTSSELESKMEKKFGLKYINMRDWCVKYGLEESGLTATQADLDAIALGNCPPQLLSDGVHFITSAKIAQAALIKRRLKELELI